MSEPIPITFHSHREPHQVLGLENKTPNGTVGDWGACWDEYFNSGARDKIKPYMVETPSLGVFCQSEPGYYNYLIGKIVSDVDKIPKGMMIMDFPATDYAVFTHEWVATIDEAQAQIGRIVGYAHGTDRVLPEGYEAYNGPPSPLIFIESYNYDFENNRFRFEVWLPISAIS